MDVEKIEQILSQITKVLEEKDEATPAYVMLPFFQCWLMVHVAKQLESIDAHLATIANDRCNDHHKK